MKPCKTCRRPRVEPGDVLPKHASPFDYCSCRECFCSPTFPFPCITCLEKQMGERVIPLDELEKKLCLCVHNHVCAACRAIKAIRESMIEKEKPMDKCTHCKATKAEHCFFMGHFICQGVRGRFGSLTEYECKPEPTYEMPDRLTGYEHTVLMVASEIYVGLAARHPDAEGDYNQAIAVREAKRLITRVVRDARRQDR